MTDLLIQILATLISTGIISLITYSYKSFKRKSFAFKLFVLSVILLFYNTYIFVLNIKDVIILNFGSKYIIYIFCISLNFVSIYFLLTVIKNLFEKTLEKSK